MDRPSRTRDLGMGAPPARARTGSPAPNSKNLLDAFGLRFACGTAPCNKGHGETARRARSAPPGVATDQRLSRAWFCHADRCVCTHSRLLGDHGRIPWQQLELCRLGRTRQINRAVILVIVGVTSPLRSFMANSQEINVASAGGDRVKHLSSGIFPWPVLK